jgi:Tfp pilus assembly protein PilF
MNRLITLTSRILHCTNKPVLRRTGLIGIIFMQGIFFNLNTAQALEIKLTAKSQQWQLAIDNQLLHRHEAEIASHERGLARELKVLLVEKNYQAVADALSERVLADDSAALLLLRGQVQLLLKKDRLAEAAFLAALKKMPALSKAHQGLSLLYMQRADYAKAQKHLVKAIELGVADAQIYGQLAYIHVKNDQPWAAVAGYRQALFLTPDNSQFQQGLLYALIQSGDLSQAQALLKQQINAHPTDAKLWLHRGQLALQQNNQQQALTSLEMALRLTAQPIENQLLAAQIHLQSGSANRAVELIQQAIINSHSKEQIEASLETSAEALNWLIYQQQWPLAKTLFENAAGKLTANKTLLPVITQTKWQVLSAQFSLQEGDIEKAKNILLNTILLDPNLGDALLSLANIYQQQNQHEQAKVMYQRAQALTGYQEGAWLGLAQIAIEQNDYRQAILLLGKTLQHNPNRKDLVANIRSLEQLVRHEG